MARFGNLASGEVVYFLSESRIDADSADFADFLFVFVDGRWSDSNCLDTDSWEEHRVGTRPTPTEFVNGDGGSVNLGFSLDLVCAACYANMNSILRSMCRVIF